YLPRLSDPEVLAQAIRDGVALLTWQSDAFAYAESYDEAGGRYRGSRAGHVVTPDPEDSGLVVKADVARRQLEAEVPQPKATTEVPAPGGHSTSGAPAAGPPTVQPPALMRRFYGTVRLDPARVGRDAGRIAEEVIAHLAGQPGVEVTVTLEIDARLPGGANEQIVRTVTENCRTLKFESHGFESE